MGLMYYVFNAFTVMLLGYAMGGVLLGNMDWDLSVVGGSIVGGGLINDWVSKYFSLTVIVVTMSVMAYSYWYMSAETQHLRFILLLSTFVFSMLILISAKSMTGVVLGWDGLGLSSYFLVVYYDSYKSSMSGLVTVISNRVGDVFIIVSIVSFIWAGSCEGFWLGQLREVWWLGLVIVLAAITKSAMFPYCTWLPEAMAAPTPVSSLVHSSTLVTAGVFLIIRFSGVMCQTSWYFLSSISACTLLVSGFAAVVCMDFKKVVALSTLNQLSFMMLTCCLGSSFISLFHLLTHALFKSSLFMAVGVVIHLSLNNQDARSTGFSWSGWKLYAMMVIPLLSLAGVTALSGFVSKEMILLQSVQTANTAPLGLCLLVGVVLTVLYSTRMISSLLKAKPTSASMLKDSTLMSTCSIIVVGGSIVGGGLINDWVDVLAEDSSLSWLSVYIFTVFYVGVIWGFKDPSQNNKTQINSFSYLGVLTMWHAPSGVLGFDFMKTSWDKGLLEISGPQWGLNTVYSVSQLSHSIMLKSFGLNSMLSLAALGMLLAV